MRPSEHAALALLCAALTVSTGCATPAAIDPMADQVLSDMSRALSEAKSFSFTAESVMDEVSDSGALSQWSRQSSLVVARPNRMFSDVEGDDARYSVWYDGKTLTVLDKKAQVYATVAVEKTIHELLDAAMERYDLDLPMADFLVDNVRESMTANVQEGLYLGKHTVDDDLCHHLAFRQELIDWQLWVSVAQPMVPRKLVITYKDEPGHPQFAATMRQWDLDAESEDSRFTAVVPEGAQQVSMPELMGLEEGEQP